MVFAGVDPITQQAMGIGVGPLLVAANGFVSPRTPRGGTISTTGITATLICFRPFPHCSGWRGDARAPRYRTGWDCGLPGLTADNEYNRDRILEALRMIFSHSIAAPRDSGEYEVSPTTNCHPFRERH